jgi:hypothetical protein
MGNKVAKIVKGKAKEFNKRRVALRPIGVTLLLLSKNGEANTYTTNLTLTKDWYFDYNGFREQTKVMVATQDSSFATNLLKSSDVKIGNDYYEIDKRDILPPDGDRGYWQFYCKMNPELY